MPSIQQKAWRVAKKNTSLKLHGVDGRTPANLLIWRIYHYLQGFFTSRVVVGDFWTISSSTWKWGRLKKEMNRNWKPAIFRVQLLVQYVCWGLVRVGWLTVYQEIMKTTSHHGKMIFHFCHDASGRRRIVHSTSYKSSDGLPSGFSFTPARRDPHNPCGSYHLFPRINLEEVWKKPSMLHRK